MKSLITNLIDINIDENILTEDNLNHLLTFIVFCNDNGKSK